MIKINLQIHIISLNVPYPPNYGGVIDIFYKVKALSNLGVKIHLHCFDYGRGPKDELKKYCASVYYYKRKRTLYKQFYSKPFIVVSRDSKELLNHLLKDDFPIFFEGLHTTYYINHPLLKKRIKIVRTHNVEHDYYKMLEKQESFLLRKMFYKAEGKKLKKYESVLNQADVVAAISPNDLKYFDSKYTNCFWLPPFHSNNSVKSEIGKGNYALYHGNLSVRENIEAALFLIKTFRNKETELIIAGKNPSSVIKKLCDNASNIKLVYNPSNIKMIGLIQGANVHLLPTFQPTGIKLKLIESLFMGRHCVVNKEMVQGTGLEKLCHMANTSDQFLSITEKLMKIPFENKDLIIRKEVLCKKFNNERNAQLLVNCIIGQRNINN